MGKIQSTKTFVYVDCEHELRSQILFGVCEISLKRAKQFQKTNWRAYQLNIYTPTLDDKRRIDFYKFCLLHTRASSKVYYRFRINKKELWILSCLYGALLIKGGTPLIGRRLLLQQITGNGKSKALYDQYIHFAIKKGFISEWEYKPKPGSISLGITKLGFQALDYYAISLEKVEGELIAAIKLEDTLQTVVISPRYQQLLQAA